MENLRIDVRGGGLTGFSKFRKPETNNRKVVVGKFFEGKEALDQGFEIVSPSSLKGMFSYLLGEQSRVKAIDKRGGDAERDELAARSQFEILTPPHFELFTKRYKRILSEASAPSLAGYDLKLASPIMIRAAAEIQAVFGSKNLGAIYDAIYAKESEAEVNPDEDLVRRLQLVQAGAAALKGLGNGKSIFFYMAERAERALPSFKEGLKSAKVANAVVDRNVISVWENILKRSLAEKAHLDSLVSVPGASLLCQSKKDWLSSKPIVTSGVEWKLKINFRIYVRDLSPSVLKRLCAGPGSATWADNGLVEWNLVHESEIPDNLLPRLYYDQLEKRIQGLDRLVQGGDLPKEDVADEPI